MESDTCNSSLYPSLILITNLLLISLILIGIGGLVDKFYVFYDVLDMILNTWHWIRTIRKFKRVVPRWRYYFEFNFSLLLSYIFSHVTNKQVLKGNMFIRGS